MISIDFDSCALQYLYGERKDILDNILDYRRNKKMEVNLFPSNVNELLSKDINSNLKNDPIKRILKLIVENKMAVNCPNWRELYDYIINKKYFDSMIKDIILNNMLITELYEDKIDPLAIRKIREDRLKEKYRICLHLLKYRSLPNIFLNYTKWLESVNQSEFDINSHKRFEEGMIEISKQDLKIESFTLEEIEDEFYQLLNRQPLSISNSDMDLLKDVFQNDTRLAHILRGNAGYMVKLDLSKYYSDCEAVNIAEYTVKILPFLTVIMEYFLRLVWGCIVDNINYKPKALKPSVIGDAEFLCYSLITNTDYFITGDNALYENACWILKYIVKSSKLNIIHCKREKDFLRRIINN